MVILLGTMLAILAGILAIKDDYAPVDKACGTIAGREGAEETRL